MLDIVVDEVTGGSAFGSRADNSNYSSSVRLFRRRLTTIAGQTQGVHAVLKPLLLFQYSFTCVRQMTSFEKSRFGDAEPIFSVVALLLSYSESQSRS